jgi:hypothetical protein
MSDALRATLAVVGLVPAAIAVMTAPVPALLAVTALGVLVGLVAGMGVAFVRGSAAHAGPIGLAVAGVTIESGLALAGVLVTLGAASVAVLPALFFLIGTAWWVDSPDCVKAMIGLEVTPDHPAEEQV